MIAGARRRDHRGTEILAKLHSKSCDAAGTALDQNSLAGFEFCRIFNSSERGEASEPQGSRLGMAETVGFLGNNRSLDGDLFRVGSFNALVSHSEHGISDSKISDARPDRADDAREVSAKDMRKPTKAVTPSS